MQYGKDIRFFFKDFPREVDPSRVLRTVNVPHQRGGSLLKYPLSFLVSTASRHMLSCLKCKTRARILEYQSYLWPTIPLVAVLLKQLPMKKIEQPGISEITYLTLEKYKLKYYAQKRKKLEGKKSYFPLFFNLCPFIILSALPSVQNTVTQTVTKQTLHRWSGLTMICRACHFCTM